MTSRFRILAYLHGILFTAIFLLAASPARAQISALAERNMSKMSNYQNECAMIKNPTNKLQLFALCNNATGGLFAARSIDSGVTWVYPDPSKTIANGVTAALGPAACCDPTLAWDTFGNLFITYIDAGVTNIVTLLSTDGGQTFATLAQFGPASVDQPTVTADSGQVWVVWNQSGSMVARGAAVTGLGTANVGAFGPLQNIPGTGGCSFGDIAIAPNGAVVQVCENPAGGVGPASLLVNIKADGLGPNPFGAAITATATNVGGFHGIPAQNRRTIDAEAGLAYDRNNSATPSPHFGRLYLVYTDEVIFNSGNTDIMVRFSDNDGATWSAPIRVNDDATTRSQFLPRIASDRSTGNIAVCWHDARNSPTNTAMQEFCTFATPVGATPAFMPNAQVSAGSPDGNGSNPPVAGQLDIQFGDYSGLAYFGEMAHPAWADDSNSTGDNPDGTARYDAYTNQVAVVPPAGTPGLSSNLLFPPTVVQSLAMCQSPKPFMISNIGVGDLTITNVAIGGVNAGDFSLSGLPAFPIVLGPGQVAAGGDLDVVFAPTAVARERTANVTVTFVTNPITGATGTQSRDLCGEGALTGARVLVTQGGVPMPTVHEIELKRLGGLFGFPKEVDEVKNVPLQSVTPTPGTACGPIRFHREYGAISNPVQLIPGVYQLKVEAIIAGKEVRKKTFFSVNTCGFDGTIVVDF